MLTRNQKEVWIKDFSEKLSKSNLAVLADYRGLSATQADDLRKTVRDLDGEVKVLKNNIARKAVAGDGSSEETIQLMDKVVGPTLIAFSYSDPAAVAKALHKFAKDNEAFELKDSLMDGRKVSPKEVEQLANLPSKEVLLATLLGTLNAPIQNFVGVLAALPRSLVTVLKAIEDKKREGGES